MRLAVLIVAAASAAQTFDVNGQTSSASSIRLRKSGLRQPPQVTRPEWAGARASRWRARREPRRPHCNMETRAGATAHAQRAVNAAPQNPDLWFTLAYAARLSGQYSLSVDAYRRGLALKPSSVQGLSGLAQTYARMGRNAEAQQTLEAGLGRESQERCGSSAGGRTAADHRSETSP